MYRHRFGMFWIYTTFVWKKLLVWKIVVDLRSLCATIRRQMALGTQARHDAGDEGIYIFVYDFCVLVQSSFWQACFLFENTVLCILHSLNCAARCNAHWGQRFEQPSVQAGLQARAVKCRGWAEKPGGRGTWHLFPARCGTTVLFPAQVSNRTCWFATQLVGNQKLCFQNHLLRC